jgi:intein/homing endonuclease
VQLSEFLKNDLVAYAAYDNVRKICNFIDGLKNSSRKVIYTVIKNNIKNDIKVNRLSSKVAEECVVGDTKIITNKGIMTIKELIDRLPNEDIKVKSYNTETKQIEWKKVIDGKEVKKVNKLIEINGIKCTPEHKFFVKRNNKYIWVEAQNIKEGDEIFNI